MNTPAQFALFPTSIGACGIAWSEETVIATSLPDESESRTAAGISARASGATEGQPPPAIERAIAAVTALLEGDKDDLTFIACDFSQVDEFAVQVYAATRAIPPGETRTYGAIAEQLGGKLLAQKVGQTLGRNPFPIIVPCHRVMGADGKLTGFSAPGGIETKLKMLAIEGAQIGGAPGLFGDLPLAMKPLK